MRKTLLLLIVVLAAVVLPTTASPAQPGDVDCRRGVSVQTECVSIDGEASLCSGAQCVEFVQASVPICPVGTDPMPPTDEDDRECGIIELADQSAEDCPAGARGQADGCFIYVAIGPVSCPIGSEVDADGYCRKSVQNAPGYFFCSDAGAVLNSDERTCTTRADTIPSPCPVGTTRASGACWHLNGLAPPETCAGHGVPGTITLSSGECQVPLPVFSGASGCVAPAVYQIQPAWAIYRDGAVIDRGPLSDGCVDASSSAGSSFLNCAFFDDDYRWGSYSIEGLEDVCTRLEDPSALSCPAGYSFDDSLGGRCARFEPVVDDTCPAGGNRNGQSCVFETEFDVFECPVGTLRLQNFVTCFATRPFQGLVSCGSEFAALIADNESVQCLGPLGPQPDICNGIGTIDDCFEIREPALVGCATPSGCITLGDFRVLGDVSCDGETTLLDALVLAQYQAGTRLVTESCDGFSPIDDAFIYDGDVNDDQVANNTDALLMLRCAAGFDAFAGCSPQG